MQTSTKTGGTAFRLGGWCSLRARLHPNVKRCSRSHSVLNYQSRRCKRSFHRSSNRSTHHHRTASISSNNPFQWRPFHTSKTLKFHPEVHVEARHKHDTQGTPPSYIQKDLPKPFDKILIANRGEIACRVMITANQLDIKTVAVYSDVDINAKHVEMADEAYWIGEAPAQDSYLKIEKIIEVAKRSKAEAIHPGYGFLSENAEFARRCHEEGIEFIGPPTDAIVAMGSKSASKHIMEAAGVPVVPGYHNDKDQTDERLQDEADKIGYPLMIKAVLGGGGKGMRVVNNSEEFLSQLSSARGEAESSFGDNRVLLEKFIARSRHVEFQVFGDKNGNVIHLRERDCSVQRRNQKVLEESPAPGMTEELRAEMGKSAVNAALAVGYVGAGTVEFIVDDNTDEHYFMEMNTRLQVEHPVTEMVTRRDLVQWQFHVAAGHPLPCSQDDIHGHGHSIEARIYAENPHNNFYPQAGFLHHLRTPRNSETVRVETGVRQGDDVTPNYDPMIAKLVVWGQSRDVALKKLNSCLQDYQVVGLPTNISFLQRCATHEEFQKGQVTTSFIEENHDDLIPAVESHVPPEGIAMAVLSLLLEERKERSQSARLSQDSTSPWHDPSASRINMNDTRIVKLVDVHDDDSWHSVVPSYAGEQKTIDINVTHLEDDSYDLEIGESTMNVSGTLEQREIRMRIDDKLFDSTVVHNGSNIMVFNDGEVYSLSVPQVQYSTTVADTRKGANVYSAVHATVVEINCKVGDAVKRGDPMVVLEAMKLQDPQLQPKDGVVTKINCSVGEIVPAEFLLVEVDADDDDDEN